MYNVAPTAQLPPAAYAPEVSEKVYERLFDTARQTLARGWPTLVDAVFDRQADRQKAELMQKYLESLLSG